MLRFLIFVTLAAALSAASLPSRFGGYERADVRTVNPDDRPVWDEFGLKAAEQADYGKAGQRFTLSAYRFADPTGAFAAFQWNRPAGARAGSGNSASVGNQQLLLHSNYLLQVDGDRPKAAALSELYDQLPGKVSTVPPPLSEYLPAKGRIANSERYLLGPQSLSRYEPRLSPALVAFERGAEAQSARYRAGGSEEVQLTLVSYPTPQIAIERMRQFEKLPNAAVRRSGTLIAVVPEGKANSAAAALVDQLNYRPRISWNEFPPIHTTQDAAKMIVAISVLAVGLVLSSLFLGLFFGGGKILARRLGFRADQDDFQSLGLGQ